MKRLMIAFLVAVVLALSVQRAEAFCLWDYCDQLGCWWICL